MPDVPTTVDPNGRPFRLTYYENWTAFPHSRDADNALCVSVEFPTLPQRGFEFSIVHVGSHAATYGPPRWGLGGARQPVPIGLQVRIFDDAWLAYFTLPALFARLSEIGAQVVDDRRDTKPGLADLAAVLRGFGTDVTAEHAASHVHHFACVCGKAKS
jgi:hypothetical protein